MSAPGRILVVDDDPLIRDSLRIFFSDAYDVVPASSGLEALDILQNQGPFDTLVLDIRMERMDGLETARRIKELGIDTPVIFYTGYPGDFAETRIEREHQPYDFVTKGEPPLRLQRSVRNAVAFHRLKSDTDGLRTLARREYGMVGKSKAMLAVYRAIEKTAPTDVRVMVLGPTGSGKELVARAIHTRSRRSGKKLGLLHCSHKPADLVQAELFGHLKGAFTGAIADRVGLFEYADGGTVFLDEVGDLDLTTQSKLLRVLETGEIQKIGSPHTGQVDVRLLCATHQDLEAKVREGTFREDMYYRLKGVTIVLPSLKSRREDIPDLIAHFNEEYCLRHGDGIKMFEPDAMDLMIANDWPGNVRQLLQTVESLLALSASSLITLQEVADFLGDPGRDASPRGSFAEQVREFKRIVLIRALARHNNNIAAAAREMSLDRSNLHKLLRDLDIETD